nr:hypothetical protein [Tanacetum cinerariifolium]
MVMEGLTLILRMMVSLSDSFRYHNHCEELCIINFCFEDDLFIFARGDVESAKVIMDSLEEFKLTSGLVLSIPKSTAYFCNVLTHIKLAILSIMPFSEGILLDIQQLICRFLWCNGEYKHGKAKVEWDNICLPHSKGILLEKASIFELV